MKMEIKMPTLNLKAQSGTLVSWEKNIGETVTEGDVLYEVETDKAIHEITASQSGTLTEILISEGDTVTSGDVLGILLIQEEEK